MIKFFRHIRKSLIEENKMGKYFKYAIGEIILVVIGILIALQINNWNEQKKIVEKEKQALTEIVSDLNAIIIRLEEMKFKEKYSISNNINSLNIIINHLERKKPYQDSLKTHFFKCFTYPNPLFKTSGYETLSSMGMDVILDNKLRSEIGLFFTKSTATVDGQYRELRDDFYNYMLTFLKTEFTYKNDTELFPENYQNLKNNVEFLQSLRIYVRVYNSYLRATNTALKDTKALKKLIHLYLKK